MVEGAPRKNILITGGAGYIGSHTVVELLMTNEYGKLIIVDNLSNSSIKALERVQEITGKTLGVDFFFHNVELNDKEALRQVMIEHTKDGQTVDACIHFAGLKAVGESVALPLMYYHNNISGTIVLLQVMEEFKCKNIVFSSSATVYGDNPVAKEGDTVQPTNAYGQTKAMIEQILRDYVRANKDFSSICLRYFNPVGAHASGLIGEDPQGHPNNLMPYIQKIASGHMQHLSVFGSDYDTPDGTGVRDYIHVTDLARAHVAAISKQFVLGGYHDINIGTGKGTSVLELAAAFEKASGITIEKKMAPRRDGDVAQLLAVPTKANEMLEWKAELGVHEMCRDAWNWVQRNPNGYN